MFEQILSGPKPWYFGHLHLPGGTKPATMGEARFELKDWQQEIVDEARFDKKEHSAALGALLRVTDYGRLVEDGRLMLLVHVLERFDVNKVVQPSPHGVAHVQILPDLEDLPSNKMNENLGR